MTSQPGSCFQPSCSSRPTYGNTTLVPASLQGHMNPSFQFSLTITRLACHSCRDHPRSRAQPTAEWPRLFRWHTEPDSYLFNGAASCRIDVATLSRGVAGQRRLAGTDRCLMAAALGAFSGSSCQPHRLRRIGNRSPPRYEHMFYFG